MLSRRCVVTLGLSLCLNAQAAESEQIGTFAEDLASDSPDSTHQSALKRNQAYETTVIGKVPLSISRDSDGTTATTVTRHRLEALPGGDTQTLTALVAMQPGVVQDSFGSNLHVRGADGAILYVIDGIPLISPSVGTVGQLLNTIPTRLVQRVDVLTGGFPVEYSYSLGGVVDVQTRRPTGDSTGEVQLLYGTYDHLDVAASYAQRIGRLSVLASSNFVSTGRGLDTPDAVTALNDSRIGGNAFLKASYALGDDDRLDLLGTFQQDRLHVPIDATMLSLSLAPPGAVRGDDVYGNGPPPFVPYDAMPTDIERTLFAALSYQHEGSFSSQLSLYVRQIYEDFNCDAPRHLGATADPGSFCSSFTRDALHVGLFSQAIWRWRGNHRWKAGFQIDEAPSRLHFSLYTRNDTLVEGGLDPTQTLSGIDDINTLTGGLYLEDRIKLGSLTLTPGLRVDLQRSTFGGANVPSRSFAGPSVRLGASYMLGETTILHGFAGYLSEAPTNFDAPIVAAVINPDLAGKKLPIDMKLAKTWSGQMGLTYRLPSQLTVGVDLWGRILQDWLDHQNIGDTALWAAFNWEKGWAAGGDVFATGEIGRFMNNRLVLDGFGNVSGQQAKQQNIDSLTYLFASDDLQASKTWTVMDHVQFWTANLGLLLHDADNETHLSVRFNYGSGFHTGVATNEVVPDHATVDISFSHTFELPVRPTVAVDAFNLFNDIYAFRLGTGFFGNSQYAPLRQVSVRLIGHLG